MIDHRLELVINIMIRLYYIYLSRPLSTMSLAFSSSFGLLLTIIIVVVVIFFILHKVRFSKISNHRFNFYISKKKETLSIYGNTCARKLDTIDARDRVSIAKEKEREIDRIRMRWKTYSHSSCVVVDSRYKSRFMHATLRFRRRCLSLSLLRNHLSDICM